MNNIIKYGIVALGGAAVGAGAGVMVAKKGAKNKIDQLTAQNKRLSDRVDRLLKCEEKRKAEPETDIPEQDDEDEEEQEEEAPSKGGRIKRLETEEDADREAEFRTLTAFVYYPEDGVYVDPRGREFEADFVERSLIGYHPDKVDIDLNDRMWFLNYDKDTVYEILIEDEDDEIDDFPYDDDEEEDDEFDN